MEGIMGYGSFWLIYAGFALLGLWCWGQILFWLNWRSIIWQIWLVIGIVLLYTPSPISDASHHFAPALFVLILDVLSKVPGQNILPIFCLSFAFVLGMLSLVAIHWFGRNKPEASKSSG